MLKGVMKRNLGFVTYTIRKEHFSSLKKLYLYKYEKLYLNSMKFKIMFN